MRSGQSVLSLETISRASSAMSSAATIWFVTTMIGQWIFVVYVALFYGISAALGRLEVWNKGFPRGHVPGDIVGNLVVATHVLLAVIVIGGGPLQLIPKFYSRYPSFHRWLGRIYMLSVCTISLGGLYLVWVRGGTAGDRIQHLGISLDALLILFFAFKTLRNALGRKIEAHRRWALRLFLAVSAVWFFRIGWMAWIFVNNGPVGFDPKTFTGPFLNVLTFAQTLLPLAVLEVYLRLRDHKASVASWAMAAFLCGLAALTALGIFAATIQIWFPKIKMVLDRRTSINELLAATIKSRGIKAAISEYRLLKATKLAGYNFDENELNALGYKLLQRKADKDAIAIFRLNVEMFPDSWNAYDSLAEAYLDDGNVAEALRNYQKVTLLNPENKNAKQIIQQINATGK